MSFLAPLALLFGLLALPILVLYMLKLRRREVEVSSTLLWQMLLRDREANAPWQKLKRNLLLILQLILLALLALALARPFLRVPTVATGTVVVLLDASASMNATDVSPSRFESARAAIRQLINGLTSDGQMALVTVGHQPTVLASATNDKATLRTALNRAAVEEGLADWEGALALASGMVRASSQAQSTIIIVSDGGLPSEGLPPLPGEVRYLPVGNSADNLAISALALRPTATGPQLFAAVSNSGDVDRDVIVSISIGGQLFSAQQLRVPAGGAQNFVLADLPAAPAVYEARLSLPAASAEKQLDALPLDDVAWAVYQPPSAGRVLVVSPGNTFLEQMLTALPGLQPFRQLPGAPFPTDPFDLYVFDGVISDTLPTSADLLLINPSTTALLAVGEVFTNTALKRTASDDPLMQFVDWSNVHVLQARQVQAPTWARVLVEAEGGPLVLAGETGGRRVAVFTFKLQESDLPLLVTYPVLMANLINYLAPAQAFSAPNGLRLGEALTIKPAGGDRVIAIDDPHGARYAATATEAGVVFADTHTLGVYTVLSNQNVLGSFAVNLFSPAESNIRPQAALRLGRAEVTAAQSEERGQLEIWLWLALAAFALLLIEWWVYQRGAMLPSASNWRRLFRRKKVNG